jgi:hypothetical protein
VHFQELGIARFEENQKFIGTTFAVDLLANFDGGLGVVRPDRRCGDFHGSVCVYDGGRTAGKDG